MSSILLNADRDDAVEVRGTMTDESGAPITGAVVTAKAIDPAGDETTLGTATEVGTTGVYAIELDVPTSGQWLVRFTAAAPYKAAAEGVIYVRETRFS